jgi:hypothetical protein
LIERAIAAIDIAAAEEMATCLLKMGKISDIEAFLIDR